MKINKIIIENINSLKGRFEVHLDQSPFKEDSLFAITGPTGSGKSTLLDAIGLAIFNEIPRFGRRTITETDISAGSVVNHFSDNAMAEVHYTAKQKNYITRWSIRKRRTGNWDTYNLEVFDEHGTKLTQKKTEAVKLNKEIIGLDFNQFRQSLLLSQGAFQKFLLSKADDRSALLEQITGTYIYRELSKQAFLKNKELNKDLEALKERLKEHPPIEPALMEEYENIIEKGNDAKKKLALQLEKESLFVKQVEEKQRLLNELKVWTDKQSNLKQKETHFNEVTAELKIHNDLEPFIAPQQELIKQKEFYAQYEDERSKLKNAIEKLLLEQQQFEDTVKKDLQQDGPILEMLNHWFNQCKEVDGLKNKISTEGKSLVNSILNYSSPPQALAPFIQNNQLNENTLSFIQDYVSNYEKNNDAIAISEIEKEKQILNKLLDQWQQYAILFNDYQNNLKKHHEVNTELLKLKEQLASKKQSIPNLEDDIKILQKQLENLTNATKNADHTQIISLLRAQLTPGESCEVCGAKDHPFAGSADPLNWAIKIAEKEQTTKALKLKEDALNKLNTEISGNQEQINKNEAILQEIHKANAKFQHELSLLFDEKINDTSEIKLKTDTLKTKITELDQLIQKNNELVHWKKIGSDLAQIIDKRNQIVQINDEAKLFHFKTNYQEYYQLKNNQLTTFKTGYETLNSNRSELETKIKNINLDIQKKEDQLTKDIKALGFESVNVIDEKTFKGEALNKRLQFVQEFIGDQKNISDQLNTITKQLDQDEIKAIAADIDTLALHNQIKKINADINDLNKELGTKEAELKGLRNQEEKRKNLERQIEKISSSNEKWFILNQLIGSSDGKKFNKIAQKLSLRQLLIRANFRLQKFNDRYSFDINNLDDDFLNIIDHYMADTKRSIRSLSGGETFLLSLCMALSLADMAAAGNKIESLFIDEGFGTLDADALESALGLLEKVQQEEGKIVGIISHVPSIKERIPTQIQLQKNNQGSSTLKIVS